MTAQQVAKVTDLPAQVFEKFLQNLTGAGIPDELVTQLHKTLLEERAFTEKALKKVVLGDQSPP